MFVYRLSPFPFPLLAFFSPFPQTESLFTGWSLMDHPLGSNPTLFFFFLFFLISFNKGSFSYISDKKLVSIRMKATDYFLKIFWSRYNYVAWIRQTDQEPDLTQSPFFSCGWKMSIDLFMIFWVFGGGFVIFCLIFVIKGVPGESGLSGGCSRVSQDVLRVFRVCSRLFRECFEVFRGVPGFTDTGKGIFVLN